MAELIKKLQSKNAFDFNDASDYTK
jgi:hypothetical protein